MYRAAFNLSLKFEFVGWVEAKRKPTKRLINLLELVRSIKSLT